MLLVFQNKSYLKDEDVDQSFGDPDWSDLKLFNAMLELIYRKKVGFSYR